ncbi:hypothetical protein ACWCXX_26270 [Streptomyces sp. NPDC001732]
MTVTNQGTSPASGTVMVNVAGQTALNSPASVPPGGRRALTATARNVASPGQTVPVTWSVVFCTPHVMGDDVALVKRLAGRGFRLNESVSTGSTNSGPANGKAVLQLLDAMTPDIGPRTSPLLRNDRIRNVTQTVANLIRQGAFEQFYELAVNTDNLKVSSGSGFGELTAKTDQLSTSDLRTLHHVTDLARGRLGHHLQTRGFVGRAQSRYPGPHPPADHPGKDFGREHTHCRGRLRASGR